MKAFGTLGLILPIPTPPFLRLKTRSWLVTWTDGRYLFDQTLPRVLDGQNTTPTGQEASEVVIL